jgi:hypothetical protein
MNTPRLARAGGRRGELLQRTQGSEQTRGESTAQWSTNEFEIRFRRRRVRRPTSPCCHVAATRGENRRDQQGRTGTPKPRKPASSLQKREMVDGLGLRVSGSSPVRSARKA